MQEISEVIKRVTGTLDKDPESIVSKPMIFTKEVRKAFGIKFPPYVRETPKVQRNSPCPCGSGLKYKKCCLELDKMKT